MVSPHVHIPYGRISQYLAYIQEHRLDLEIFVKGEDLDHIQPADLTALKEALDYGPSLSVHAPFMDLSPGGVDPRVRAVTMDRFSQTLDLCEVLRPKVVVFHSGYEKWKYDLDAGLWLGQSLKTWPRFIERAAGIGTAIAIENIFEDEPSNLVTLMQELGSEHFGICFDTGHFNLFSTITLREWIEPIKPYIKEFHLHDNMGDADSHMAIGEGKFDFSALFGMAGAEGVVHTIENHTPEKVILSMKRLAEHLG